MGVLIVVVVVEEDAKAAVAAKAEEVQKFDGIFEEQWMIEDFDKSAKIVNRVDKELDEELDDPQIG